LKKDSAEALMQKLLELSNSMNQVCDLINQLESEEEREQFRRGMSGMLADVYTELMRPLIRQFPELDPDK
jgi:DNA-binding transcriptional LysR family regulator